MLAQKLRTMRSKGLRWCIFCQVPNVVLGRLGDLLGLHPWHVRNRTICRPYKKFVADLVNGLKPDTVVEVGCGLGDIIAMVKAEFRYGIDPESRAIQFAPFFHPFSGVKWLEGNLSTVESISGQIDVLFAIGWLHDYSPDWVRSMIEPYLARTSHIIVDRFLVPDDTFHHQFEFLNSAGELLAHVAPPNDGIREYLIFKIGK